ncbi:prolipoprotein diacylglyceryl transferase 2 [Paraoerskovia sediminicola]|uniref:Phosphatidylglycerol--prolipoprotein diacylglyceryl transferase n=1 Tax=Paraoerskovia sediminicola TaxID=1138587 RepID=A0ABN6XF43_9CELL|nr:prolipoprotein diacylglyceryl transferase [Paraoerskovia sediminicola]BDZ43537.1 prolipoprotein diacylglyceryl transferase 2 [Paraoerskovia sediminicola]
MSASAALGTAAAAGGLPAWVTCPDGVSCIPSPSSSVWYLGPVPLRAYAFAILAGIAVAVWLTSKRWVARGGVADDVLEIAFWAVPFGIVGGRIYHVISTPEPYWGADGDPWKALRIWDGGLGIWGAVALGAVGAYIGCRRQKVSFAAFADALAPGLLLAQAIGRLGNWFNQELFGAATTAPWGLAIDAAHLPPGYAEGTLFHPTFLYEMLWNIAGALLLIWLDRRFRLGHGRVFWLYVVIYTLGRVWIEMLRIDTAELVLGVRLNVWTSVLVGLGALIAFIVVGRRTGPRGSDDSPAARLSSTDDSEVPDPGA